MASAAKHPDKDIADRIQVTQGQIAFIQLPIPQSFINDPTNGILDSGHVRIANCPDRRFAAVRQHDQRGFLGLRFRSFIPEVFLNDAFAMLTFRRLLIKIRNERGSVMLADNVRDYFRQFIFPTELQTIPDMGSDDHRRKAGRQFYVGILHVCLIFHEEERALNLADIVIIGAYP